MPGIVKKPDIGVVELFPEVAQRRLDGRLVAVDHDRDIEAQTLQHRTQIPCIVWRDRQRLHGNAVQFRFIGAIADHQSDPRFVRPIGILGLARHGSERGGQDSDQNGDRHRQGPLRRPDPHRPLRHHQLTPAAATIVVSGAAGRPATA